MLRFSKLFSLLAFFLLFLFFPLLVPNVFGQAGIRQDDLPRSNVESSSTNLTDEQLRIGIRDQSIALGFPIPIFDWKLLPLASHRHKILDINPTTTFNLPGGSSVGTSTFPTDLYNTKVGLGLIFPVGDGGVVMRFMHGTETDGRDISSEDYVSVGQLLYDTDPEAKESWQLGAIHTTAFGVSRTFPGIGYKYKGTEFAARILLPILFKLSFKLGDSFVINTQARLEGGIYRLTEDAPWNSAVLRFSNIKSTLTFGWNFAGPFVLDAGVGWVSNRRWRIFEDGSDSNKLVQFDLRDQIHYTIGIGFWPFEE